MALSERDLEDIENLVCKTGGDLAAALGRGFERIEEHMDATQSRYYARLAELEDKLEAQAIAELERADA